MSVSDDSVDAATVDEFDQPLYDRIERCIALRREVRGEPPALDSEGRSKLRFRLDSAPPLVGAVLTSLGWEPWCEGQDERDWNLWWRCSRFKYVDPFARCWL